MMEVIPDNAYELLTPAEQSAVDQYVNSVEIEAARSGVRIAQALERPIPDELVKRSRGMFLKPLVLAAISEKLRNAADAQDVSPRRVIAEHAALAFSNIADFLSVDMFGQIEINLTRATRDQLRAVKSVKITETPAGRKTEFTLYDKTPSLNALQSVMDMPLIADSIRSGAQSKKLAGDPEQAYTNLLESVRPV